MSGDVIYTHDEAMLILEMVEDVLAEYNIYIPSPEDEEREPDNMVGFYGSVYSDLMDGIEANLIDITERVKDGADVKEWEFSGTI